MKQIKITQGKLLLITEEKFVSSKAYFLIILTGVAVAGCVTQKDGLSWDDLTELQEYQLTRGQKGHFLSTTQCFSPSDEWIVYDTRNEDSHIGQTCCIEAVNANSKEEKLLYKTQNQTIYGPGVGAATFSPVKNRVLFIHGLTNSNAQHPYGFTRRTGVAVDVENPGMPVFMDARDVTYPFTAGALRGGTHAHTWSGDGQWIGFTYNDDILAGLERKDNSAHDLRVVGVMAPDGPVTVSGDSSGENNDGVKFSVIVTRVTDNPKPGSDEISKAYENGWVGSNGYIRTDGKRQKRAIAFLGDVRDEDGQKVTEVFVVDIPDDITTPAPGAPIEGTRDTRPMPPAGTKQRRLTYTTNRLYPGVQGPRHWMRSTPDGSLVLFLMKDDKGIAQVYGVAPTGHDIRQVTHNVFSVETTFNISPDGNFVAYGSNNQVYVTQISTGETRPLTRRKNKSWSNLRGVNWSNDGRMIAYNRKVSRGDSSYYQIFLLKMQ